MWKNIDILLWMNYKIRIQRLPGISNVQNKPGTNRKLSLWFDVTEQKSYIRNILNKSDIT